MYLRTVLVLGILLLISNRAFAQEEIWSWEGEPNGFFGASVASAGDVDNDGHDDVIIGDYRSAGGVSGAAFVYSGDSGELLHSWSGETGFSGFGRQVAGLGDVDGDDFDDVIVSAFWESVGDDSFAGRVYAFSGATGDVLWSLAGESASDYFGRRLAPLGDVNDDGIGDVVISSDFHSGPGGLESGKVFVVDGTNGDVLWTRDGENEGDRFGADVGGIDDVDGDGRPDVLVGAFLHDSPVARGGEDHGKMSILSGASGKELFSIVGENAGDRLGFSVDGVDGLVEFGLPTFVVGIPGHDSGEEIDSGRAILYASDGTWLWSVDGKDSGDFLGSSVSGAGDANGDGVGDFLIGIPRGSVGLPGMAVLYSGETLRRLWTWTGERNNDAFGLNVSSAGDVDRDGLEDLLIGAYRHNAQGKAFVFSGNDLFLESPDSVMNEGDLLFLTTRGGPPSSNVRLFVTEANGLPFFINVANWTLDHHGEWTFASSIPPEAVGLDVTFLSIADAPGRGVHDSNLEVVSFR